MSTLRWREDNVSLMLSRVSSITSSRKKSTIEQPASSGFSDTLTTWSSQLLMLWRQLKLICRQLRFLLAVRLAKLLTKLNDTSLRSRSVKGIGLSGKSSCVKNQQHSERKSKKICCFLQSQSRMSSCLGWSVFACLKKETKVSEQSSTK